MTHFMTLIAGILLLAASPAPRDMARQVPRLKPANQGFANGYGPMTAESLQMLGLGRTTLLERIGPFALFPAAAYQ
jgi:hypothetical protein